MKNKIMQPSFILKEGLNSQHLIIEQFVNNHKLPLEPKKDVKTPVLKNTQ